MSEPMKLGKNMRVIDMEKELQMDRIKTVEIFSTSEHEQKVVITLQNGEIITVVECSDRSEVQIAIRRRELDDNKVTVIYSSHMFDYEVRKIDRDII